jgi:hypothetical protein
VALFKKRRLSRYNALREKHFSPTESREFSKLRKSYPALKEMIRYRQRQWDRFQKRAKANDWGVRRTNDEWRKFIVKFYEQKRYRVKHTAGGRVSDVDLRNWIVTKDVHGRKIKPRPSPWEWYDAVFNKLPDEQKKDTPRSHRAKNTETRLSLSKIQIQSWIAGIRATIRREPERRTELEQQIRNLLKGSEQ